jgi:hypothetical protein
LPTGTEFSYADYMANLDRTLEKTESVISRRIELATTPRSQIRTPSIKPAGGTPQAAPSGPAVGAVIKGYKFKGGNPADPKSWEKAQ